MFLGSTPFFLAISTSRCVLITVTITDIGLEAAKTTKVTYASVVFGAGIKTSLELYGTTFLIVEIYTKNILADETGWNDNIDY